MPLAATLHWMWRSPRWCWAGAPVGPPLAWLRDWFVRAFLDQFAPAEWRVGLDRAVVYRRADGNVRDKERDRLTKLRL